MIIYLLGFLDCVVEFLNYCYRSLPVSQQFESPLWFKPLSLFGSKGPDLLLCLIFGSEGLDLPSVWTHRWLLRLYRLSFAFLALGPFDAYRTAQSCWSVRPVRTFHPFCAL